MTHEWKPIGAQTIELLCMNHMRIATIEINSISDGSCRDYNSLYF